MNPNDTAALIAVSITIGVVLLALITTFGRRRGTVTNTELAAINEKLARMEQAIDAMAVETERISEGQRFATKLLSERAKEPAARS
jgi:hypothetical protein